MHRTEDCFVVARVEMVTSSGTELSDWGSFLRGRALDVGEGADVGQAIGAIMLAAGWTSSARL